MNSAENSGARTSPAGFQEMAEASAALEFERAAALRDELRAIAGLQHRGLVHEHVQPEAFFVDPAEGLAHLAEILSARAQPRMQDGPSK